MFLFDFFKYGWQFLKYKRILSKIYTEEQLPDKLSQLLGTHFKIDWLTRLYAVFNPIIIAQNSAEYPPYEYSPDGTLKVSSSYLEKYIMQRLLIANDYIMAHNIFDLVTYTIRKVTLNDIKNISSIVDPERIGENYLFIIEPIPYQDFLNAAKKLGIFIIILLIILLLILIGILIF